MIEFKQISNLDINHQVIDFLSTLLDHKDKKPLKNTLDSSLKHDFVKLFLMYIGNNPIGFAYGNISFGLESKGAYFWLNEFHLSEEFRSLGYGMMLMDYLKMELKKLDITYIALVTGKMNEGAKKFFQKSGFHERDYVWYDIHND